MALVDRQIKLKDEADDPVKRIYYSPKYYDETYEYRHVMLPKEIAKNVPKGKLMSETEWRSLGVVQSQGWNHYMVHTPEPHILLFRRPITNHEAAKRALMCS